MRGTRCLLAVIVLSGLGSCSSPTRVVTQAPGPTEPPPTSTTASEADVTKPSIPSVPVTQPAAMVPPDTTDQRPDFVDWPVLESGASLVGREFESLRGSQVQKIAPSDPLPLPPGMQSFGGRLISGTRLHGEIVSTILTDAKQISGERGLSLLLIETLNPQSYRGVVRAELHGERLGPGEIPDIFVSIPGRSCTIDGSVDDEILAIVVEHRDGARVTLEVRRAYRFSAKNTAVTRLPADGIQCPALQGS